MSKIVKIEHPKQERKKRRKRHRKSVLQVKDGRCLLCKILNDDFGIHKDIEEHHVFFGTRQRWKSEEDGLKVYLCPEHHRIGPDAVHKNAAVCRKIQAAAQMEYERVHGKGEFIKRYGKNYIC